MNNVPKLRFKADDGSEFPEWEKIPLGEIVEKNCIVVDNPGSNYTKLAIRSHCKGTFHKFVGNGEGLDVDKMYLVEANNLIVNITFAWEHAIAITKPEDDGTYASHRFPQYKFKNDNLPSFYEYVIKNPRMKYELSLCSPGGAGRNRVLNQTDFLKIQIAHPIPKEQQKIADFLSTIDDIIAKSRAEVDAWEKRKKGVIKKLFSQEVRFKADDGSEFPEWEEKRFGDVVTVIMGQSPNGDSVNEEQNGIPLIQGKADILGYGIKPIRYTANPTKICEPTDVIMTVRAPVGYVAKLGFSACIGRGVCAIRYNKNADYIYYFLQYKANSWKYIEQGSTFSAVNSSDILSLIINIPSLPEQQKIADCLSSLDEVIKKCKKELAAWEELKKGLLQRMFV